MGMTERGTGMTVNLSFPNVSIGNPEENGSPIRSGMTERGTGMTEGVGKKHSLS